MRVYHGSDINIEVVDLSKCQPAKDFGQGFYVTKYLRQAEEMATRTAKLHETFTPIVTEFEFNEWVFENKNFQTLRFDGYNEEWLDFIILNRSNQSPAQAHTFDIVEGPVADDDVTKRIYDYFRGDVSKAAFLEELKFKKPMHQICFCTNRSLRMLWRVEDKAEVKIMHIASDIIKRLETEHGLTETIAYNLYYGSTTYQRLIDESSGLYLQPWTEIYQLLLQELGKI
ncbi:MAG: DUF3990 domain-containing protein [Prevotellaceae bacterium]|jgi:hypothetical protein|nr:DUF3990 domain-containing protein [Prevotellaceae bacterium]